MGHPAPPEEHASTVRPGTSPAMSEESRRMAGVILLVLPTAMFGGVSLLSQLLDDGSGYAENPLRQDLWRAGHAHAAVLLLLTLIALRWVDDAVLSPPWKSVARHAIPAAALLMPAGFFLSVLSPTAEDPNALIALTFLGAAVLAVGVVTLGIGLVRRPTRARG